MRPAPDPHLPLCEDTASRAFYRSLRRYLRCYLAIVIPGALYLALHSSSQGHYPAWLTLLYLAVIPAALLLYYLLARQQRFLWLMETLNERQLQGSALAHYIEGQYRSGRLSRAELRLIQRRILCRELAPLLQH